MPKKKTHEDFIKQVNEKFYQVEVLGKYSNNKTPINFKCKIHNYTWEGYPRTLLMSECGCPKCGIELRASKKRKTHEVFIEEMKSINKNIQILSKYSKSNEYIKCKCKIDGYEWEAVASGLLSGNGCPKCGIEKVQAPRRRTQEQFIEQLHDINPNIELTSSYIGSHDKISVKCNVCDYEWTTLPGSLLYKKSKCPQCIGNVITPSYFKEKIYNLVKDEYSLLTDYVDCDTRIIFKHNKCGKEFKMKPISFIKSKTKCPNKNCKHDIYIRNNKTIFNNKIVKLGFELIGNYNGSDNGASFKCLKCDSIFYLSKASSIFSKHCCAECSKKQIALLNIEKYNKKFTEIYGDEFEIYSDYIGSDSKIKILHKKCNNISTYSKAGKIISDYMYPCKYCNISKGEKTISDFLEKHSIEYEFQKKFNDLIGVGGKNLSYDFFIKKYNLLIEFQGKQHYYSTEYFGGEERLKVQQEHDKRKRQYAKDNSINILEISYLDFNNIEKILLKELQISA